MLLGNERRGLLDNKRRGSPSAAFRSAFAAEARGQRLRIHEHVEFSTQAAGETRHTHTRTLTHAHTHTRTHTHAHAFLVGTALAGKPRCAACPHRGSSRRQGEGEEDGHHLVELHDKRSLLLQSAWPAGNQARHMIHTIRQTKAHSGDTRFASRRALKQMRPAVLFSPRGCARFCVAAVFS